MDFYVDNQLLASDSDGPPFDTQWTDENPFEKRELMVKAEFSSGTILTDTMTLEPLELTEATEITSVLVEASVLDDKGRFVKDLAASDFEIREDNEPQALDLASTRREHHARHGEALERRSLLEDELAAHQAVVAGE